jgi:hypothetical protein
MVDLRIKPMSDIVVKSIRGRFASGAAAIGGAAATLMLAGCLGVEPSAPDSGSAGMMSKNELAVSASTTYKVQAEAGTIVGAKIFSGNGAEGTYVDFQNASGDYIQQKFVVPSGQGGNYTVTYRYANGSASNRALNVSVSGATTVSAFNWDFPSTGSWATWKSVSKTIKLNAGTNYIRAAAKGSSGGNFDWVTINGPITSTTTPWRNAVLTWFESYPDPGSDECIFYHGCDYVGMFAALPNKMSLDWVKSHNIISVHEKDFSKYRLKTFRIKQGTHQIDAVVYDECADSDCEGCCTKNAGSTGFLIDMEKYTLQRFGASEGIVSWTCLNCL